MSLTESLDELIARRAVEFADEMKSVAAMADKEEQIRIEVEKRLAFIQKEVGIKLESRHEFTVASGRIDSVYSRVIIEYKNPRSPGDRIGPKADSPGSRKVVEQIKRRFYDMRSGHGQPLNTLFGVGFDGRHFLFVRFRDDKWQVQEPIELSKYSAERFLWALFNLGTAGQPFTPEYLAADFGAEREGTLARNGVRTLYEAICTTENPKALTFFSQWKILFGEVCGYDVETPSEKIRKLAHSYEIPEKGLRTAELLFALHTYYALLMKLLANEIVNFPSVRRMTSPLEGLVRAATGSQLRRELEKLESGGIFPQLNITNFLEGDLFAWYLPAWSASIETLIRDMVARLDRYNPDTLSEDPAVSRDLLKKLYHQLFPKSVRHDLGEYYTPDWLAELVLDELGYEGDPDKRLLDPACGSGTFLVMAINRIRHWYDKTREARTYDKDELCRKIASNVVGFDLNPLAVLAARTNYLIAIRDLLRHVDQVEIPIYLCDSILAPSEYGESDQQMFGRPMRLQTGAKPTPFFIPREVTTDRGVLARYTNLLAELAPVKSGYSVEEFLQRIADDGLPCTERDDHLQLFEELRELDEANKNGVWARIIKNAFAPLFVQRVDYVVGNPPWVNWESLPEDYRNTLKPIWQQYGLFTLSGSAGRLGGGKKDLSMLFVYAAVDDYLKDGGRLGFVITQTVFKTKGAGDGFRQLHYERTGKKKVVIKPVAVHDLSDMQVFEGATNRTAVFVCEKQTRAFQYPVPYVQWRGPSRIEQDKTLPDVRDMTQQAKLGAVPVEREKTTSPWLTAPRVALGGIEKVIGKSEYTAYAGCCTWLNGVFFVRILRERNDGTVLVENLNDVGKIPLERVQAAIESELLYDLIRGRDVSRWSVHPSAIILLTQDAEKRAGIDESVMKRKWPRTYAYLKQFEGPLRKRSGFRQYFRRTDPFYSVYNVGPYTLSPWKVLWTRVATEIHAAVIGPKDDGKPVLSVETATFVPFENMREAHYFAALMNSSPSRAVIESCSSKSTGSFGSPHVLTHVAIPRFASSIQDHRRLSKLSQDCHQLVGRGAIHGLRELEAEIDSLVAAIWRITSSELTAIQELLAESLPPQRGTKRGKPATTQEADE